MSVLKILFKLYSLTEYAQAVHTNVIEHRLLIGHAASAHVWPFNKV